MAESVDIPGLSTPSGDLPESTVGRTVETHYSTELTWFYTIRDQLRSAISALVLSNVDSYTFNSGSGSQTVKRRDLPTLRDTYDWVKNEIRWYEQKLAGGGVMNMNLRRK